MCNEDTSDMKDVPIGNDNFRKIRENDGYYVDKTELIKDILSKRNTDVFLFTRPRRFGKSLNISMLDAFFNIDYGDSSRWFEGLKVMEDKECIGQMNSSPVISISLKDLKAKDMEAFRIKMAAKMSSICMRYRYVIGSDVSDNLLRKYERLSNEDVNLTELEGSLKFLSDLLYDYHKRKVIILIDEYDSAINHSYMTDIHNDVIDFIRGFMSQALKTNDSLRFGVVTGVMQIAKESIFSDLNNLSVNNIFTGDFDEGFGFTESEVMEILSQCEHPEGMRDVKEWYDGYRFGKKDVYNPWSILNYIRNDFKTDTYWINEGNPAIIMESVRMNGPDALRVITDVYNDGTVISTLNRNMTFSDLGSMEGLLSLLTGTGYFKAIEKGDSWELSLVNKEVRKGLIDQIVTDRWRPIYINRISKAMLEGDAEGVRVELGNSLDTSVDSKITRNERYYQAFTLGLINCLTSRYYVRSEYRGGKGYADIAVIPRDGKGPSSVLELKDGTPDTDDSTMQAMADGAIEQIHRQRYFADLHGRVELYGIAIRQTDVFISHRSIDR